MSADTATRLEDVPLTSTARAEADESLSASKRMIFTYARHVGSFPVSTEGQDQPKLSTLGITPLVDPTKVPDVLRAVLLEDGTVKVNFRDNTVVRLDTSGSAFTVTTPEGETLRQLSEFAVTRFSGKVQSALEFRNAHADTPFLPPSMAKREHIGAGAENSNSNDLRFRASARVKFASWSRDAQEAEQEGFLTRLEGGAAAIESTDGVARVVLSAHGLVARVTYPLLYAVKDLDGDAVENDDASDTPNKQRMAHDYVWHTSTFSADNCPPRWQFPVALLTQAVYEGEDTGEKENANGANKPKTQKVDPSKRAGSVTTLPVSSGLGKSSSQSSLSHGLWVNEGDRHEQPWWSSPAVLGFPDARDVHGNRIISRRPSVEHAPGQTTFVVRSERARSKIPISGVDAEVPIKPWVEVVSILDQDGDVLVSVNGGKFVTHVPDEKNGLQFAKMYDSQNIPDRVAPAGAIGAVFEAAQPGGEFNSEQLDDSETPRHRVPIGRFAERCLSTRAAADFSGETSDEKVPSNNSPTGVSYGRSSTTNSDAYTWGFPDPDDPDPWSVLDADIQEESAGEGSAAFVAYKDGRVRVKFADRTLLTLRRDHQACRMLLKDGELVEVRCSNPMAWRVYTTAATEFGRWAFLTPEDRELAAQEDRVRSDRVQAELDWIHRFSVIDSGIVPLDDSRPGTGTEAGRKQSSLPSTPDRPKAQPSAPTTPHTEHRSPLRESPGASPLGISVPASPLDGARIRRRESLEKMEREWEEDLEVRPVAHDETRAGNSQQAMHSSRSRALFREDSGDSGDGGMSKQSGNTTEEGVSSVAAVAHAAAAGVSVEDGSPPASVQEALAATERWLEGVKDELSPTSSEDAGMRIQSGAANRMDAVASALDANEKWLANELEDKAKDLKLDFTEPPDF